MKYFLKTLSGLVVAIPFLFSCSGDGGFTTSGGSSSTNIISGKHFSIGFDNANPTVVDDDGFHGGVAVSITVTAGDRYDAIVTTGTVYFRTEYGLLYPSSCELESTGTCSVTWQSELTGIPADYKNTVTAYTLGEEGFYDLDGSSNFNDGDTIIFDTPEPFLDIDHEDTPPATRAIFNAGSDIPIDLDNSGGHTLADGLYNGAGCTHSSLCGATTLIYIYDQATMDLDTRTP